VPLKLTVCAVPEKFPVIERVPVSGPRTVGVNVMLIVQESPGAKVVTQLLVCEKSPEEVTPETEKLTWPLFVKVTD
jgi:hypothetical protein